MPNRKSAYVFEEEDDGAADGQLAAASGGHAAGAEGFDKFVATGAAGNRGFSLRRFLRNNNTFWILTPRNPLRAACLKLANSPVFDNVILFFIIANCAFLAADNPLCDEECAKTDQRKIVLGYAELAFTGVFTFECIVQIIARCFIFGQHAYLTSPWNWLDFVCVVTSYSFLFPGGAGNMSGLRAFRAMRPLRTINGIPGMRLLVSTLIESVPLMLDVLVLIIWMFFVFGIIGMQFFMGKLRKRCFLVGPGGSVGSVAEGMENQVCSTSGDGFKCPAGTACHDYGMNPNGGFTTFDSFPWACLSIMHALTLQGWTTDEEYALYDGAGALSTVFFTMLVMFGAFFALNLLTAIISAKFAQLNDEYEAALKAQAAEEARLLEESKATGAPPPPPEKKRPKFLTARVPAFTALVEHDIFNTFITACILINTGMMAIEHHNQPDILTEILEMMNLVLNIIFQAELVLKHVGLGLAGYWGNNFNKLDGFIVAASVLEMASGGGNSGLSALRTFRLLRILRSMKLLKQFPELSRLMRMVLKGFIALKDFMLFLLLFIFIFSILGMQLFGGSEEYSAEKTWAYRKNFNSLWESIYTVFEILTGANWFTIMWNGMRAQGTPASLYFVAWTVIGSFVLLTLFLAILLANFSDDEEDEAGDDEVAEADGTEDEVNGDAKGSPGKKDSPKRSRKELRLEQRQAQAMVETNRLKMFLISIGETYGIEDEDRVEIEGMLAKGETYGSPPLSEDEVDEEAEPVEASTRAPDVELELEEEEEEEAAAAASPGEEGGEEEAEEEEGVFPPEESEPPAAPDRVDRWLESGGELAESNGVGGHKAPEPEEEEEEEGPLDFKKLTASVKEGSGLGDSLLGQDDYVKDFQEQKYNLFTPFQEMPTDLLQPYSAYEGYGVERRPGPVTEAVEGGGAGPAPAEAEEGPIETDPEKILAASRAVDFSKLEVKDSMEHLEYTSLFVMKGNNPFRLAMLRFSGSKPFEYGILVLIIYSSILLAIDTPSADKDSTLGDVLQWSDLILTIVFTLELLVKVLAQGFILHRGSYMRQGWNQLDFIIVTTSILSLVFNDESLQIMKTFRLMRALRPLRMISRLKGMQIVVTALIRSMPSVINVVCFGGFIFGVFGIMGVQLFGGKFWSCNDHYVEDAAGVPQLVTHRDNCTAGTFVCEPGDVCAEIGQTYERRWANTFLNFDHLGEAVMSLFVVTTMDDWMVISYGCMDAVGVDRQPVENHAPYMAIYVFAFVFLGSLFWVNLLVGVIIDHYNALIAEMGSDNLLTEDQKKWMDVLKIRKLDKEQKKKDALPDNKVRAAAWRLAFHPAFEVGIMACIVLNVLVMAMAKYDQGDTYGFALEILSKIFTITFIFEAVVKITALLPPG